MRAVKRITFAIAVAAGVLTAGCTSAKHEIVEAKHSLYDTDFAVVYSAALDATRILYPNIDDSPGNGQIKTAWHQVQYASDPNQDIAGRSISTSPMGTGGTGAGGTSPAAAAAGMSTRLAYKRYYVRFDVSVIGGRPWRVKVVGHASEWEPGAAMPTELRGPARPSWLDPRVDALRVAIHQKVKPYRVAMKEEADEVAKPKVEHADPAQFTNVPAGAAKALALVKDVLGKRDYAGLRPVLADDVVWNAGAVPSAETAMAMWQADPDSFESMVKLIGAKCAADGEKRVTCPGDVPPVGQWQLVLEPRGESWRITQFMRIE